MAVQTASAVPTGRLLIATPSSPMLATMAVTVPTVGQSSVKPLVYLSPMAQPISKSPAKTSCELRHESYLRSLRDVCQRANLNFVQSWELNLRELYLDDAGLIR
jgi:hypothetical protein